MFIGALSQQTYIGCEHRSGVQGNIFPMPKANGNLDVRFHGEWWEKPRRIVLHIPPGAGIPSVTVNGKRHSARQQLEIDIV